MVEDVLFAIQERQQKEDTYLIKSLDTSVLLDVEQILYFEADDKDTSVVCNYNTYVIHKSLNELEVEFGNRPFFRIHRKYLVNLLHIKEFDISCLTLDNGKSLSISRRSSKKFREVFEAYLKGGF